MPSSFRSPAALALLLAAAAATAARAQPADEDDALFAAPRAIVADLAAPDTVVFTGDELVRRGFRTLGDVLAFELGVLRGRTARGVQTSALGVPAGFVLVVDGVPRVVDGERAVLDVEELIALSDVERVEIVRGPVTALAGAGALTGAVRVTLKQPGVTGASVRGGGTALASSASERPRLGGGERELVAEGTLREGDVGARAFVRVRGGAPSLWRVDNAPTRFERIGTATLPVAARTGTVHPGDDDALLARVHGEIAALSGEVSYARSREHAPLSSFSHGLTDDPEVALREQVRGRAGVDTYVGPLRVEAQLGAGRHASTIDVPLFPRAGAFEAGGALALRSTALFMNALARVDVPITDGHRVLMGAVGDVTSLAQRSSSTDPRTGDPTAQRTDLEDQTAGASLAAEYQGDLPLGLHATAGLALEWRASFPVVLAPRVGLAWDASDSLRVRAGYSEGVRAPDRYDLRDLGAAVVDGRVLAVGRNDSLRPEHVRMLDAAMSFQPSWALRLHARLFGLRHEDALVQQADAGVLTPKNLAPRHVGGAELSGAVSPWADLLRAEGGVSAVRTLDGADLGADALQAVAGVSSVVAPGVTVGVRGRAKLLLGEAARSRDGALLDGYASFDPAPALSVTFALRNILDTNESTTDVAGQPFAPPARYPGAGRALVLSVEGRL